MQAAARPTSLDEPVRLLKAFADPVRLRLLSLLQGAGEVCVCHLHGALDLPQPTVSRHLAYLRKHGLVRGRKAGLWVHYRPTEPAPGLHQTLFDSIKDGLGDDPTFAADRERLARVQGSCESP